VCVVVRRENERSKLKRNIQSLKLISSCLFCECGFDYLVSLEKVFENDTFLEGFIILINSAIKDIHSDVKAIVVTCTKHGHWYQYKYVTL